MAILFKVFVVLVFVANGSACSQDKARPQEVLSVSLQEQEYAQSRVRMQQKFGRHNRAELLVDAVPGEEFFAVMFYVYDTNYTIFTRASQTHRNRSQYLLENGIPEKLRIEWRDTDESVRDKRDVSVYSGRVIGNEVIEVGSRIPQEVLDDLKRDPKGVIRLKFRMNQQGTMFAWDIERRIMDLQQQVSESEPAYSHAGGDFKAPQPATFFWENGKHQRLPLVSVPVSKKDQDMLDKYGLFVSSGKIYTEPPSKLDYRALWEKGWYVDRKTGKKIASDH